jgi:hypothetical protein
MSAARDALVVDRRGSGAADGPLSKDEVRFGHETVMIRSKDTSLRQRLHLVGQVGHGFEAEHPDVSVLYRKGRYLIVDVDPATAALMSHRACYAIKPLPIPGVVFKVSSGVKSAAPSPKVSALLATLSAARAQADLGYLASFDTRQSTSPQYYSAAMWAADRFRSMGCSVEPLQGVDVNGQPTYNVIATFKGTGAAPRELVLVTAHLDSINHEGGQTAPGADDNASGVAGVLELATCLASHSFARDLQFVLFGGEEQDLNGSTHYVSHPPTTQTISAVVNLDMIATRNGTAKPTMVIEGAAVSAGIMTALEASANTYTGLTVETSTNYWGSDHVPFIDANLPAVLLIEGSDRANHQVHSARDTVNHLDYPLMLDILRANLAFLVDACVVAL